MKQPLRLIVNPVSGGGLAKRVLPAVEKAFFGAGLEIEVSVSESLDHARVLAETAARAGASVVALGGDGLVGSVFGAVADSGDHNAAVGVIPAGRGNDFARHFGIRGPERAVEAIATGKTTLIDLGVVENRYFASSAGIGIEAKVLEIAERVRIVKGGAVYAYAAVRALMGWQKASFTIEFGDTGRPKASTVQGYNVVVANTGFYGGGMSIAPRASACDGLFNVVSLGDMSKFRLLASASKIFKGTHIGLKEVHSWDTAAVSLTADRPLKVYADGEFVTMTPTTLSIVPNAVRLYVPDPSARL